VTAFLWGVAATLAVVVLAAVCTDADARHDWLAALAGLLAVPVVILGGLGLAVTRLVRHKAVPTLAPISARALYRFVAANNGAAHGWMFDHLGAGLLLVRKRRPDRVREQDRIPVLRPVRRRHRADRGA
jgi:hypothetical protein